MLRSLIGKAYTILNDYLVVEIEIKGAAGESSEGSEERGIETWRKGNLCYIVAESLTNFYSAVMWEAGLGAENLHFQLQRFLSKVLTWSRCS